MTNQNDLIDRIMESLEREQEESIISGFDFTPHGENQLLFFFKPECFRHGYKRLTRNMFDMVFKKFDSSNVQVNGMLLLSGSRIEELSIIDRHYGFINKLSREASRIITDTERNQMVEKLDIHNPGDFSIYGGHEFLKEFPGFNAKSLNESWLSKKSIKLRSGFYFQEYTIDEGKFILVNGFHPIQIQWYTLPVQKIIVLVLNADTDWNILKNDLVGNTFPDRANENSIRGEFFKNHLRYGVSVVNISYNCTHLSAGPFEAFFELDNFFKSIDGSGFDIRDTRVARLLQSRDLPPEAIPHILSNPKATVNGAVTDLYTCTEEKNTKDAIDIYCQYFKE